MRTLARPSGTALLAVLTLLVLTEPAARGHGYRLMPAFYPYHSRPFPYPGYYPGYYDPFSYGPYLLVDPYGYLKGSAEVIDAQGKYLQNVQQAYLLQEQVKAAMIENRRRELEQRLWERSKLPTLNDERERVQQEELRRSLHSPPPTEIWSGYSLNELLRSLQELRGKGREGPAVPLDADALKQITVTTIRGPENPALLRDGGPLSWPVILRELPPADRARALRMQIDALLVEGRKQVVRGLVDPGLVGELERSTGELRQLLADRVNDYSFRQYYEGRNFLRQLDDAAPALRHPDAVHFITGRYRAQGATVKDLVNHLTDTGLRFAPSPPGSEAAYNALHQALVRYHLAIAPAQAK
jgi:hypothetical protein